ncbi:MAG: AsmA-like C-terminal region-containing protein [Hyphomicrobiaceae bacterium]
MFAAVTIRRAAIVFAAVAGLALIAGLPIVVNLRLAPGLVHSSSVHAGSRGAVVVTTPVRLSSAPNIVIQAGWVRDADARLAGKPANDPAAKVIADGLAIRITTSAASVDSSTIEEDLPLILAQLSSLDFQSLQIRRGTITIVQQGGGTETLSDVAAEITSNRKGGYAAKGTASYRGSSVTFDTTWTLPADRKAPLRVPIKIALKSAILNASIDGRLAVSDDLRLQGLVDISAGKLRHVARWFGIPVSNGTEFQDVRVKGTLDWGAGILTFSRASVAMDGNEGTGAIALDTSKAVPSFDGTLAFDTFDLSRYLAPGPSLASLWSLGVGIGDDDVAPSVLTRINADMRLSASKIAMPHLQTGRGAATVALTHGKLQADIAELELEGGSFGGQITADMASPVPHYGLSGKLENVDAGRSLSGLLHRNPLQGRANISLDLAGSGHDTKSVLGSLSGKAGLVLSDAGRLGLDLRALLYAAQRSSTKGWASAGKGQTALDALDLRVTVADGVATADQLIAKSAGLTITGNGRANIAQQLLHVTLQFNNAERAPSSNETLVVSGTWTDPEFRTEGAPKRAAAPGQQQ